MECSITGCPGRYEERSITHTVQYHGEIIVIDHVPADEYTVCGDVLLRPETVGKIVRESAQPAAMAPVYEYA